MRSARSGEVSTRSGRGSTLPAPREVERWRCMGPRMEPLLRDDIQRWLVEQGLAGASETQLLEGLCGRLVAAGLPLARGLGIIDTLHPVWEGRAFIWRADGSQERSMVEYGSHETGEAAASWEASAFYHLLSTGGADMRRCFDAGDPRITATS